MINIYEIIKYVSSHYMDILFNYSNEEDLFKIRVSVKRGVSVYAVDRVMYGVEILNTLNQTDVLFDYVKEMVESLEKTVELEGSIND